MPGYFFLNARHVDVAGLEALAVVGDRLLEGEASQLAIVLLDLRDIGILGNGELLHGAVVDALVNGVDAGGAGLERRAEVHRLAVDLRRARIGWMHAAENLDQRRLVGLAEGAATPGAAPQDWRVSEVGDGNLNLVFIVRGPKGALIVKQALPYVRLVGDGWPLPFDRALFENLALLTEDAAAPGLVPKGFYSAPCRRW